ncbi:MAG: type I restriction endonuclease subunit R [Phormidesmis sp.]
MQILLASFMTVAITEAIKTLAEAERRLELVRTEDGSFFTEWQSGLPNLSVAEQEDLDELRQRYLYQRSEGQLLEGTVTLLLASPLLAIAGLYDPPFLVRAEESIQLRLDDGEEILQGRIDVLVIKDKFWVVVLESKKTALSVWAALPQTLAYLMANPHIDRPCFGMVTNGDDIFFIKLARQPQRRYALSRVFAPLTAKQELYSALQILKQISHIV